jgi:hypothetical protein
MQLCVAAMQDIPSSNRKDLVLFGSTCMIRLLEQCTAHIHVVETPTFDEHEGIVIAVS